MLEASGRLDFGHCAWDHRGWNEEKCTDFGNTLRSSMHGKKLKLTRKQGINGA